MANPALIPTCPRIPSFSKSLSLLENAELNNSTHKLNFEGKSYSLTPHQSHILYALFQSPNELITREWMMEHIWRGEKISSRSIDAHVSKLKKAVGEFAGNIVSVYGKGYILSDKASKKAG